MAKEKEQEQEQEQQAQQPAAEATATASGASASGKAVSSTPTVIEGTTREDAISKAQAAIGNASKNGERLCASPLARDCVSGKYVIRLTKM